MLRKAMLLLGSSLTVMAGATIAPALPAIRDAFTDHPHADLLVPTVLTIPSLFIALGAPAMGYATDRFGRRRFLLGGIALFAAAGGAGLFVETLEGILISRAVLGIGIAAVMTSCTALIGDYFAGEERSRFMGLQGAFMAAPGAAYVIAGGVLADIGWRMPFAVFLSSLALLPGVAISIRDVRRTEYRPAPRSPSPLPRGRIAVIYSTALVGMAVFFLLPVQAPFHLRALFGMSGAEIALVLAGTTALSTTGSLAFARVHPYLGHAGLSAFMFALFGAGYLLLYASGAFLLVLLGLCLVGFAVGFLMPNLNVWLLSGTPEALRGRLVGGITTCAFLGQFVSPLMVRPLIENLDMAGAFGVVGAISLLVAAAFVIRR